MVATILNGHSNIRNSTNKNKNIAMGNTNEVMARFLKNKASKITQNGFSFDEKDEESMKIKMKMCVQPQWYRILQHCKSSEKAFKIQK